MFGATAVASHGRKSLKPGDFRFGEGPRNLSQTLRSLISMSQPTGICDHNPVWVGRIAVTACADCRRVEWLCEDGPIDHAEAMAAVFGTFDLIGTLDALGAPSAKVLIYAPPNRGLRKHLTILPLHVWLQAGPHLWLSHDGEHLLLSTSNVVLFDNMTRGA